LSNSNIYQHTPKNYELVQKFVAHHKDIKQIERLVLTDPKALYFAISLEASMTFKSCKIGSVPLGFKVT